MATFNKPKRPWIRKPKRATPKATGCPTIRDIEWSAGFLEGEGSFIRARSCYRGCELVAAGQNTTEPLLRLQRLFGGTITVPNERGVYYWQTYGARARGIGQTMFALMTRRRKDQIKTMLKEF